MDKKPLILVSICTVVLLVMGSSVSSLETPRQHSKEITDPHSYHMILSGQKIWKVVKFNFSDHTNLQRHYSCRCSMNDSNINFIAEFFDRSMPYSFCDVYSATIASPDRYYQYNIGPFYGFHSHIKDIIDWGYGNGTVTISEDGHLLYYTFISYMNDSYYDIWLNWPGNATISETEGTDVFAFDRHDFTGNLNIGRKRGTFIVNGQKEISIENQLVAWYYVPNYSTGREVLKYKTPTGKDEWISFIDRKGVHVSWNESSYDFNHDLWWGSSGTWQFSVNMFNLGLKKKTPNVCLIGADIRRPN